MWHITWFARPHSILGCEVTAPWHMPSTVYCCSYVLKTHRKNDIKYIYYPSAQHNVHTIPVLLMYSYMFGSHTDSGHYKSFLLSCTIYCEWRNTIGMYIVQILMNSGTQVFVETTTDTQWLVETPCPYFFVFSFQSGSICVGVYQTWGDYLWFATNYDYSI